MSGLFIKLDVEYAADDEFIEAGPYAELLFVRGLCFMKRKKTDGKVKRSQLPGVALSIPNPAKHAQALVEVGLWEVTQDGWYCPSFLKRNPSKADIATELEMAREAGEKGNHERWHIGPEGKVSPKCRLCKADRIAPPIGSESGHPKPPGSPETETEPDTEAEAQTEEETKPSARSSSDDSTTQPPASGGEKSRRDQVLDMYCTAEMESSVNRGATISNPTTYRKPIYMRANSNPNLDKWLDMFPTAPVSAVSAWLQGDTHTMSYYPRADEIEAGLATVYDIRSASA